MRLIRRLQEPVRQALARLDAALNRLYGWRFNPLYQSGTITVLLLLVLLVTGIWLLLFYRIGAPWASVAGITASPWTGNWVRGLHRYASDAALVAVLVHLVRMFAQDRAWGPRALAWVSGLVLLAVLLVSGWTGYVMVWDTFGRELAVEGARWLDALPVLSEPVSRAFSGERPLPDAFFFLNLFLHVALPLGMGLLLLVHVGRLARPALFPPRRLSWTIVGLLTAVAVLWPLDMAPEADPLALPASVPVDWWYAFWLPVTRRLPVAAVWGMGAGLVALLTAVPWLVRPRRERRPPPSVVDRDLCTGCRQCALDCPWEAIALEPRTDGRADLVARVDPARCVSCGICAGSCAPMGVGPPGRTGRAQLEVIRGYLAAPDRPAGRIAVLVCRQGAAGVAAALERAGADVHPVDCAGNLHSSVIEFLVRGGAAGVLVAGCPPRDCRNREGPRWLHERLYQEREAELQARVERDRVRVVHAGAAEGRELLAALGEFAEALARKAPATAEADLTVEAVCDPVEVGETS